MARLVMVKLSKGTDLGVYFNIVANVIVIGCWQYGSRRAFQCARIGQCT